MLVVSFQRPVRRRLFLAVTFLGWLLLARGARDLALSALPASRFADEPLRRVNAGVDAVTLTFNIDWGTEVTRAVLDALAAAGVRATFFVRGAWAAEHPELIRRIRAEGHDVGSLGSELTNLATAEVDRIRAEIEASVEAIRAAGAPAPSFFRPPGGAYDDRVVTVAHELGLRTVLWDVDALDWLSPAPEVILARVLEGVGPGSLVLLHASDHNRVTPRVLPRLIERLRQRGLHVVPLSELLGLADSAGPMASESR